MSTSDKLDQIRDQIDELGVVWPNLLETIQDATDPEGGCIDFEATIPRLGRSLSEYDARLTAILGHLQNLPDANAFLMVPDGFLSALADGLVALVSNAQQLRDQIGQLQNEGGVGSVNEESFVIGSANQKVNVSLQKPFATEASQRLEQVLVNYTHLATIIGGPKYIDFTASFEGLTRQLDRLREAEQEVLDAKQNTAKVLADIDATKVQANRLLESTKAASDESSRLKDEAEKDRKTLSEYGTEGTTSLEAIRKVVTETNQLKSNVEAFSAQFQSFQTQMDGRLEQIGDGEARQTELFERFDENEKRVSDLVGQAEAMLSGATVAGLAGEFGSKRDHLKGEVDSARRVFYFSMICVAISILPLVASVFPVLEDWLRNIAKLEPTETTGEILPFLAEAAVRSLLLIPAAWFARFAASRYSDLFRLKEDYEYKHSIAASVEGFKKQAPEYSSEIAASTLFELTFNPTSRLDDGKKNERHPNPVLERIMNKLGLTSDGKSK